MFPSFPRYKEGTGGRGQIEPGPPVVRYENADDFEKLVPRLLAVTECCVITNLVSHDRKMARMIVMPKDAKPEEVRELYDDFATTYDEVCYKYYLLYVLMMNVQRPVV